MTTEKLRKLDVEIQKVVFGSEVSDALCPAMRPDGCWTLHPDSEVEDSSWCSLQPVFVSHCSCDLMKERLGESEFWQQKWDAEKPRFGHLTSCLEVVPHYSTDIAAAWLVVKKLIAAEPDQDFHLEHREFVGWAIGSCHREEWIIGETAEIAICKTALHVFRPKEEK